MTGVRVGTIYLVLLISIACLAPWIGLKDPNAQPDTLVLKDLPPGSEVPFVWLKGGEKLYATNFEWLTDGSLLVQRKHREQIVNADELLSNRKQIESERFWLGTDKFGRDVLSRIIYGARKSLPVGALAALMALCVGASLGLIAGLFGGWIDTYMMRLTDVMLAIPRIFLAILLVSLYKASYITTIVVIGATTWMVAARLVRGEVLSVKERSFVSAAKSLGVSHWRLGWFHLLPLTLMPIFVESTLRVADAILLESALSFLSLGVQPPDPSWGNLIADGRSGFPTNWWVSTFPGIFIAMTVMALNGLAEGMRSKLSSSAEE